MSAPTAKPGRKPRNTSAATVLVALRFTEAEHRAVQAAAARKNLSISGYIRSRLFKHAQEVTLPKPVRHRSPEKDLPAVLAAIQADAAGRPLGGLAHVSTVMRSLTASMSVERAQAALLLGSQRGVLELRPESGVSSHPSADDLALCPRGWEGVLLTWCRLT